ncbi:hypothetical protein [Paenibacillus whitsoniae]|uniref:Uncharacterized protein n=1 Tax=Paenibacillus whitsoniae TaxID=2496558 RepID=A0A430J707_9BACL|nr:hypothetical protein [Paenibacillus whitsoniae]RTE04435.1 hypothetical protein EJQ19_26310 [Paenibacillus whitsoniae]
MPNYVPYLLLACIAILITIVTAIRKQEPFTLFLHLSFAGMIYVFEVFVLVVFEAYTYYPKFLKNSFLDSMVGATFSDFFIVPSIGVLLAFYQLRWPWIGFFAAAMSGLDVLFVHLGLYSHEGWSSWYTFFALLFFFPMCRIWIRKIQEGNRSFCYLTYLMFAFSTTDSTMFILLLSGLRRMKMGLYPNPYRDDVILTVCSAFAITLLLGSVIYATNKRRYWAAAWVIIIAGQYILYRTGHLILFVQPWIYAIAFLAFLGAATWMDMIGLKWLRAYVEKKKNYIST